MSETTLEKVQPAEASHKAVEISPGTSRLRQGLTWVLKIAITVLFFGVMIQFIPLHDLEQSLLQVEWITVSIAATLLIPNLFFQFLKWKHLVHLADPGITNQRIFTTLMIGFVLGLISPGRIGEMGKGMFIKFHGRTLMVSMSVLDKVFSYLALALFGLAGLGVLVFTSNLNEMMKAMTLSLAIIFAGMLIMLVGRPNLVRVWIERSKTVVRFLPMREPIIKALSSLELIRRRDFQKLSMYGLLFQATVLLQFYLIVCAFGPVSIGPGLCAVAAVMFTKSLLPITLMDLGVREGAAIYFLGLIYVPAVSALSASLLLFCINVALPSLAGLFYFLRHKSARSATLRRRDER